MTTMTMTLDLRYSVGRRHLAVAVGALEIGCNALLALSIFLLLVARTWADAPAAAPDPAASGFYVYPKNGQSQQQQSADRYECYLWAKSQTRFDPAAPAGGVAPGAYASRRTEYLRAMTACLDARGYSVSSPPPYGEPSPAAAPLPAEQRSAPSPELKYKPFRMQIDGGYAVAAGTTNQNLTGGPNAGFGFAWFPTSALPVALRVDGNYSWLRAKNALLAVNGGGFTSGHENVYGGDADLQLDLAHRSLRSKWYLLGGVGWYREQTDLRRVTGGGGGCAFYFCAPSGGATTATADTTSVWHKSWNAGLGWEIAVGQRASYFIEARYERILPYSSRMLFVPITMGLRF